MTEPEPPGKAATAVYDVTVDGTTVRQNVYADGYTALTELRDKLADAGRPIMTVTHVPPG